MLTSPKKTDFCSSPILDNIVISTKLLLGDLLSVIEYLINFFDCGSLITSVNAETPELPREAQRMISPTILLDTFGKNMHLIS